MTDTPADTPHVEPRGGLCHTDLFWVWFRVLKDQLVKNCSRLAPPSNVPATDASLSSFAIARRANPSDCTSRSWESLSVSDGSRPPWTAFDRRSYPRRASRKKLHALFAIRPQEERQPLRDPKSHLARVLRPKKRLQGHPHQTGRNSAAQNRLRYPLIYHQSCARSCGRQGARLVSSRSRPNDFESHERLHNFRSSRNPYIRRRAEVSDVNIHLGFSYGRITFGPATRHSLSSL